MPLKVRFKSLFPSRVLGSTGIDIVKSNGTYTFELDFNEIANAIGGVTVLGYTFSTTTTDADPGAGIIRLDSATQSSATTAYVDLIDRLGNNWQSVIDTWDDSSSTVKGVLVLTSFDDPTKYLAFQVTAVTSASGYRKITLSNIGSSASSPFAAGDVLALTFSRTGDAGDISGNLGGESTVASATTTDIGAATTTKVLISGTTTITSLGTEINRLRIVRFEGVLTLTYNATSLILPGAKNIFTTANDVGIFVSDGSGNWRCITYRRSDVSPYASPPALTGYINGLTLSNAAGDPTNDITIATGAASDTTGIQVMTLSSTITKQLDAVWAVGTNAGGLDTGAIANGFYHLWLIRRSDTGVVDALFSTSDTSPTMPTNYDQKRRIGTFHRAAGVIRPFRQLVDWFLFTTSVLDVDSTAIANSRTLATVTVPPSMLGKFRMNGFNTAAPAGFLLQPPSETDGTVGFGAAPGQTIYSETSNQGAATEVLADVDSSSRIALRGSAAANNTVRVMTLGWFDTRGR